MTSKPILFSDRMVRAILNGTKTVTRRIVRNADTCPYYTNNGTLWVREAWAPATGRTLYRATTNPESIGRIKWHPSIFMPRTRSRIILQPTSITKEKLQDMQLGDVYLEGIDSAITEPSLAFAEFIALWDSINADRGCGWDTNPRVWRVEFKLLHPKNFNHNFNHKHRAKVGQSGPESVSAQQETFGK